MENASKALIIAGAILLSIAIIGVGMAVFNNASESISGADVSTEEVTAYNSDFTSYEGNVRGSRAKTLVTTVRQHNLNAQDDSEKIQVLDSGEDDMDVPVQEVDVDGSTTTAYLTEFANELQSGKTYSVSFGMDPTSGKITTIYIVEQGGSGSSSAT